MRTEPRHRPMEIAAQPAVSRRVEFSDVGDNWWRFLIEAGEPFQVLLWTATHVTGQWSSRMLAPAEVRKRTGIASPDHRFLVVAFRDEADAQLFALWQAAPCGRA